MTAAVKRPAIQCRELSRVYGDITALRSLDLDVPAGSIFGFLGRNGAGKTTTMRLLTGLAHPTTGRAWVNGVETTGADSSARAQFGYLPQDPAFYGWMTGREYLDYVGRLFGMERERRRARVTAMLALADLEKAADRRVSGYSGGMQQRLGVAQALLHEPPVLLLDEPTSALDPAGRYELLSMIEDLRGRVTVFLSSHILADIERVCDTVAIIHEGSLVLVSDREALLAEHAQNVMNLEVERGAPVATFVADLEAQPWVQTVTAEDNRLRVVVRDGAVGKHEVFGLIAAHELPLLRYEWARPSLEEVFLSLSR
jgi:ABC-2 type transport system ATP-binding protein